jgi:hypothetical protein
MSKLTPPSKNGPMMLNKDSFTLSVVGRVLLPGTLFNLRPLYSPAITRICTHLQKVFFISDHH